MAQITPNFSQNNQSYIKIDSDHFSGDSTSGIPRSPPVTPCGLQRSCKFPLSLPKAFGKADGLGAPGFGPVFHHTFDSGSEKSKKAQKTTTDQPTTLPQGSRHAEGSIQTSSTVLERGGEETDFASCSPFHSFKDRPTMCYGANQWRWGNRIPRELQPTFLSGNNSGGAPGRAIECEPSLANGGADITDLGPMGAISFEFGPSGAFKQLPRMMPSKDKDYLEFAKTGLGQGPSLLWKEAHAIASRQLDGCSHGKFSGTIGDGYNGRVQGRGDLSPFSSALPKTPPTHHCQRCHFRCGFQSFTSRSRLLPLQPFTLLYFLLP